MRCCSQVHFFFQSFSFSFLFADCSRFLTYLPPAHPSATRRVAPHVPRPQFSSATQPPSPHSGTPSLPCLGLGHDVTSPHVSLWDAPHARWCFSGSSFFSSFFSFFADRFPSLLSAHRGPFRLQMQVGAPSFLKSARAAPDLSSLFYFFFPADRSLSSQVHWNPLLFTNAGGSPSSRICMCCISA